MHKLEKGGTMFDGNYDPMEDDEFMEYGLMLMEDLTPEEAWAAYHKGEITRKDWSTLLETWGIDNNRRSQEHKGIDPMLGLVIAALFFAFFACAIFWAL